MCAFLLLSNQMNWEAGLLVYSCLETMSMDEKLVLAVNGYYMTSPNYHNLNKKQQTRQISALQILGKLFSRISAEQQFKETPV